jgi:hypothetical protein
MSVNLLSELKDHPELGDLDDSPQDTTIMKSDDSD